MKHLSAGEWSHFISRRRALEWQHTLVMFYMGCVWALPYRHFDSPLYVFFRSTLPEEQWAFGLILLSLFRCGALIVNGRAPKGSPIVRGLGALCGATFFATLGGGLLAAPAGLLAGGLFAIMSAYEMVVVWRATRDLRRACNHYAVPQLA